jgi:hypothetical protein
MNVMTYEVCQVDHAVGIEQHVIGLDVPVHDALAVYVPDCAAKLCYPKPHCFLCKGFPRNVEPKIAAVHQIDHDVSTDCQQAMFRIWRVTYRYSISWKL